jgi:hypothetical protein
MEDGHLIPDELQKTDTSSSKSLTPVWLAVFTGSIFIFLLLIYSACFLYAERIFQVWLQYTNGLQTFGNGIRWYYALFSVLHLAGITGMIMDLRGIKSGIFFYSASCILLFIFTFSFSVISLVTPWIYLILTIPFWFFFLRKK